MSNTDGLKKLGILAGGGRVPEELAIAARDRGWPVHVVAIDGEADAAFPGFPLTRVNWGQIGRMIRAFKENGVSHLAIVGRVTRPDLTRLKPDFGLVKAIFHILKIVAAGGDDGVLRKVVRFFEGHGFTVIGPADIASHLTASEGVLSRNAPQPGDEADIALGMTILRILGPFDVGQSVAVRDGKVLAIEGAEGTDRMLERIAGAQDGPSGGVLVKHAKPNQDLRVDMPVIGPDTVNNTTRAGLSGIAVGAGKVLLTSRDGIIDRADQSGMFIAAVSSMDSATHQAPKDKKQSRRHEDEARALQIIAGLRPHLACRAVVVAHKYVLAIESGEGIEAVLKRVSGLRQWGSQRIKKRIGVAALVPDDNMISEDHIRLANEAGLEGIAIPAHVHVAPAAAALAKQHKLQVSTAGLKQEQLA